MLPQMLGVTLGTFGIGRMILWTGRYKVFPVVGTAVAAGGLFSPSATSRAQRRTCGWSPR